MLIRAVAAVALASNACGGSPPPGSTTETLESSRVAQPHAEGRHAAAEPMAGGDEPAMAPEIKRFHDTLAPRWHAEHGTKRMTETCNAIGEFHTRATEIEDAAPPAAADPRAWAKSGKALSQAVVELAAACKANDATAFEPAFDKVHDSFHRVMEAGGAGEHHEPMAEPDGK
ncbi:MAG TPA: hypothetical protein VFP84_28220 [Kofleriaceae bacterium]|nr:hypothetical protein [Kofleriaceae bacterium]